MVTLIKLFEKISEEETLPNSFLGPPSPWYENQTKTTHTHKNHRPISLMNIGAELLNRILANRIKQHIKKLIQPDQVGFSPGIQGFFNIHKSINVIHHINKLKDENHMIISINAQKAFGKIQHPFIIKILQKKMDMEGTYIKMVKNCKHPPNIKNKTTVSTLTTVIEHSFGSHSYSNRRRKRDKRNPDWKRSKTLTVCRWHNTTHRKP